MIHNPNENIVDSSDDDDDKYINPAYIELNFSTAIEAYENFKSDNVYPCVDYDFFSPLKGKILDMATLSFCDLEDKYPQDYLARLEEVDRLARIAEFAFNDIADGISIAFRLLTAIEKGELRSSFLPNFSNNRNAIDFCWFLALSYLVRITIKIKENKHEEIPELLFEAFDAQKLGDHVSYMAGDHEDKSAEESNNSYFSHIGRKGALIRHDKMRQLRDYSLSLYKPEEWQSANQAASEFRENILEHSRLIGANLTPSNAQRTIAEWLRKKSG